MKTIQATENLKFVVRSDGTIDSFTAHGYEHHCRPETRVRYEENLVMKALTDLKNAGEDFSLKARP